MGLSASQARFLQLSARMSDLELEGQQINQQRLNLANQTSALSEQALAIPVPTAPSTYDYMKDVYTGKTTSGGAVKAGIDENGALTVAREGKNIPTLQTSGTPIPAKDQYTEEDPKASGINKGGRSATAYFHPQVDNKIDNPSQDVLKAIFNGSSDYGIEGNAKVEATAYEKDSQGKDDTTKPTAFELKGSGVVYSGESRYTLSEKFDTKTTSGSELPETYGNGDPIEYYTSETDTTPEGAAAFVQAHTSGYSDAAISSIKAAGFVNADGSDLKFDSDGNLVDGNKFCKKTPYESINGQNAYELDEIPSEYKATCADLITRIKNYEMSEHNGTVDKTELGKWRITVDATGASAYKIETDANGNKSAQSFASTTADEGWIESAVVKNDISVVTGTGNITLADGTKVMMVKSTELDETAYKAAEADYKNKKADYDFVQEQFNQKSKRN